jgi:hypothetical protein
MRPARRRPTLVPLPVVAAALLIVIAFTAEAVAGQAGHARTAEALYRSACAACHGVDGRGQPRSAVGFEIEIPDFTDCRFATREPDADWLAVMHDGGPVRAFDRMMPAFGEALEAEALSLILGHVRTFCASEAWPRGELNVPRALFTEKAFPEDEAVLTTSFAASGPGHVVNEFLYERRFGPRSQVEVVLPIATRAGESGSWSGGIGDVALAVKHALWHSHARGAIVSVAGEVVLPTGDEAAGLGKGVTVFEPFVAAAVLLPSDAFLQVQAGFELPADRARADREAFWRAVAGKTFTQGAFGRAWSPMVELLASKALGSGARTHWDVAPQMQITLNTRQHVMLNAGVRVPLTARQGRGTRIAVYLLWDWFDGGLFDGW